ncbi:hypothetical protein [Flavobacterium ginsenosidimutans]|uniref:hypothetical protein n=1 Tax=Flavobacterium ginsenosidimutans TaxID=687844 RepID=UPI000DADF8BD|nr:hypothetical protein [Flavobacterium ginsenosidimutans]KAF2330544.1 hypothetical protein DM444_14470 [Flavobacterium ginsenosidimutans]
MSTNHNRIKVADLETNQQNKILITNSSGELEFSDVNNIKADSYNGLDYTQEGKALDARQGKVLKDLIDDINQLLVSDNADLNSLQKLADAIETVRNSFGTMLVNDLITGGSTKALTAEQGKILQNNKLSYVLEINTVGGITYTYTIDDYKKHIVFSSANPVTVTIPTNLNVAIPIGTEIKYTQKGAGIVTIGGSGITINSNVSLSSVKGETRILRKIDTDEWVLIGNIALPGAKVPYTVFIDTVNGNDSNGIVTDSSKPFKTAAAAYAALPANDGIMWTLYYLDSSTSRQLPATPLRPIKIMTPHPGVFLFNEISGELSGGNIFEVDAPLSTMTIKLTTGTCSMRPTVFLRLRLFNLNVYAMHTGFAGFFGNGSYSTENMRIEVVNFYCENTTSGLRLFGGQGDVIVRKFTSKANGMRLKNDNTTGVRFSFYEVYADTYALKLEAQDTAHYYKIMKYSGNADITDGISSMLDVTGVSFTCPSFTYLRNQITGRMTNLNYAINLPSSIPNSISIDNFIGRINSFTTPQPIINIRNSTLYLSGLFANGWLSWSQGNTLMTIIDSYIIQDTPTNLFTFQNSSSGFMTLNKIGFFKTNATNLVNPATASGTGVTIVDLTPNSH